MEKRIIVTRTGQYPIYVGEGLIEQSARLMEEDYTGYYIVTDSHVAPRYLSPLEKALEGHHISSYVIPAGEQSKKLDVYEKLITDMLEKKMDRSACVIALGGGVVGDLAGFVAATFLRGVAFIQIPTTLLAHDSSVGGKVGIDHPLGKNLIGSFYPPAAVIYDINTLKTLPEREMRSGFVELIKHSLIHSEAFYHDLKATIPDRTALTAEAAGHFLMKGIGVKAEIVEQDEHEHGRRMLLNFGHTLGHAIEKELGYGKMSHGEAVAVGILFAMRLSQIFLKVTVPEREIDEWFSRLGLPVAVPAELKISRLLDQMKYDKKNRGGQYRFVLMHAVGQLEVCQVPETIVADALHLFAGGPVDRC